MSNIKKEDLIRFANSFKSNYYDLNEQFRNSINNIYDSCYTYFLHNKPMSYVLEDWEYNSALSEKNLYLKKEYIDLRPIFENFHRAYLREQIINKLLNGS